MAPSEPREPKYSHYLVMSTARSMSMREAAASKAKKAMAVRFTSNLEFNPLLPKFNLLNSTIQACLHSVCSTSREKRTVKHSISMIMSSQY